jgi:Uncharacterised nucleotidyltransferase
VVNIWRAEQLKILNYQQLIGVYQLNREQKLLLQACMLEGGVALAAWQEWKESVDIEVLDAPSNAVLCQLYQNLSANCVRDEHMGRLKGIYKRNWYHNQLLLKKVQSILQAFQQAQIPLIVLGDLAIVTVYCENLGQIAVNELNFLVHPSAGKKAIAILAQLGWIQMNPANSVINEWDLHLEFEDKSGMYLSLQGHLFWAIPQEYTDKELWDGTLLYSLGNVDALMLCPTDLFLHLSMRTFYRGRNSTVNLLVNAMLILQQPELKIDWIKLITQAQKYRAILPLKNILVLLRQLFEPSIPDWVLPALNQMPMARQELIKYQLLPQSKKAVLKSILYRAMYRIRGISQTTI